MPKFRLSFLESNDVTPPSKEELEKAIAPYLTELGRVVFAWNELHDKLALLFRVVGGFQHTDVAYGIWHSTMSDRSQREMLRATVEKLKMTTGLSGKYTDSKMNDIISILNKTDTHSNRRNEVLHAAFETITEAFGGRQTTFQADTSSYNPKSLYLAGKDDLLKEFTWRSEWCSAVSEYVDSMAYHLMDDGGPEMDDDYPWPKKPSLPHRDHKTTASS